MLGIDGKVFRMRRRWFVLFCGGLVGGLVFFIVYVLLNKDFSLSLYQRIFPVFFGVVAGGFLADALYRRRIERDLNQEHKNEAEEY